MAHRQWQEINSNTKGKNETYYHNSKVKYEQMSKQTQLIEQKKLEIQKRMEEKKKKETEDALKKLSEGKQKIDSKSKRSFYGSYSKKQHMTGRDHVPENEPSLPANIFSNDGSFFQQFQKISGIKVEIKKRSASRNSKIIESSQQEVNNEMENTQSEEAVKQNINKEDGPIVGGHVNSQSPSTVYQSEIPPQTQIIPHHLQHQQVMQQGSHVMQQQIMPNQHHPAMHQFANQQPPLHQQVFTPQQMPMPPMNYPPQFNPMQCGMMLPPPMAPSSIPPPAPLNPGSIPSPSPLQPCSIPSPSPLQPYAIPPPSPLLPHSIPPPSPMVPHSIPPPSPLTPHSIPPPLPLRPQSIPPPMQHPPMFLSMAPPPPPPPEDNTSKNETNGKNDITEKNKRNETNVNNEINKKNYKNERKNEKLDRNERSEKNEIECSSPPLSESIIKPRNFEKMIEDNVKDLFKNDEYSSSSDEEESGQVYGPSNRKQETSDSDSDSGRNYPESNSDKESDIESDYKIDSHSGLDSDIGQESQSPTENESESAVVCPPSFGPIIIEDTETLFPSDTKDSSYAEGAAPADLSSEDDNQPGNSDYDPISSYNLLTSEEVKQEIEDMFAENSGENKEYPTDIKNPDVEFKQELKTEIKEEKVKYGNFVQGKKEILGEISAEDSTVKSEDQPPKKKRKSRWATNDDVQIPMPPLPPVMSLPIQLPPAPIGPIGVVAPKTLGGVNMVIPPLPPTVPTVNVPGMSGPMISKVARTDSALVAYAMKSYGHTNLSDVEWKKVEDHYKINLLYQDMMRKREELQRLEAAGKYKYEYDSDEDTEGGTWEHKVRSAEMEATQLWADELTEQAKGKHHIGDFLPPDELNRFMEKYEALKDGREPDLSDYKEFKLKEDNVGFQMLQKLGWTEGQGLGPDGSGIMDPVNKAMMRPENQGLGVERPDDVEAADDEYDAYRKRMMLAYRFRPNPMNNPRRPYY